jgi:predicted RND superfamily exporter protein
MADDWTFLWNRLDDIERSQKRIERKQDAIISGMSSMIKMGDGPRNKERQDTMAAIKDVIAKLQSDVRENKDASDAVQKALQTYAQVNSDLTDQLKAALASVAEEADVTALSDIVTQLEANNNELHAAAPATAAAVVENTAATA